MTQKSTYPIHRHTHLPTLLSLDDEQLGKELRQMINTVLNSPFQTATMIVPYSLTDNIDSYCLALLAVRADKYNESGFD